jgi:hypothetical protein
MTSSLSSRTTLIIGVAAFTTAMIGVVGAQAPAPATVVPPTPRDADGHPVLQGLWIGGAVGITNTTQQQDITRAIPGRGVGPLLNANTSSFGGLEADGGARRTSNDNVPLYKPEYWDQITDNDYNGNQEDPVDSCITLGVPRMGIPNQIVKAEGQKEYEFKYRAGDIRLGYAGSEEAWDVTREIWADGRPHNKNYEAAETAMGDSTAHWDGDTLVIETDGFTDSTWMSKNGWIHGFNMKVTERLTRVGNNLVWEATVDDPEYLQQPWVMTPIVATLNTDPNAVLGEDLPCLSREPFASHVRSG